MVPGFGGSCTCDGAVHGTSSDPPTVFMARYAAMAPKSRPIPVSRGLPRSAEGGRRRFQPPVKMKHLAIATMVPAALAGVTVSAAALASSSSPASPPRPAVSKTADWVTVKRGDTLKSIGAAHDVSWQALAGTPPNNAHVRYPYHLAAGEHLRIPANPKLRAAQFRGWEQRVAERERARERAERRAAEHAS